MRKLLILVCLGLLPVLASVTIPFPPGARGPLPPAAAPPAPSYTLVYDAVNTGSANENNFGNSTDTYYTGEQLYNDSTPRIMGKIGVRIALKAGSITGKTFTVRVWTLTGTSLNTEIGTSTGIAGNDSWGNTNVTDFTLITPVSISSGTNYAVTIDAGGTDGSNYATCYFNGVGSYATPWPADRGFWRTDKTQFVSNNPFNTEFRMYTTP